MAKGYPSRREDHHPILPGDLLAEGVCLVCKRQRADDGAFCASCSAKLGPPSPAGPRH